MILKAVYGEALLIFGKESSQSFEKGGHGEQEAWTLKSNARSVGWEGIEKGCFPCSSLVENDTRRQILLWKCLKSKQTR